MEAYETTFFKSHSRTPYSQFTTVGVKHVKFWSLIGNTLKSKRGIFGEKGHLQTVLCCAPGTQENEVITGTMDGGVYVWSGNELITTVNANQGPIYSIRRTEEGEYVLCGKFGHVSVWDGSNWEEAKLRLDLGEMNPALEGAYLRSVDSREGHLLVGSAQSEIVTLTPTGDGYELNWVTRGHQEGELWGLAVHPLKALAATASDDKTLRIWNLEEKRLESITYLEFSARSVALSIDGERVAVGMKSGQVQIFNVEDFELVKNIEDRKQARHCAKYSPDGSTLAVGSNDNRVDFYETSDYGSIGVGAKNSSFITQLDWSRCSGYIAAVDGAGERLVYTKDGRHVTARDELDSLEWDTITGVVGAQVEGVFPKYSQLNDVNNLAADPRRKLIATGDDFGLVKLFRFPCVKRGSKSRKYNGHSAHVTNVNWTHDGKTLLSTGGADHAVFQWRLIEQAEDGDFQSDDEDNEDEIDKALDSDSEASDSSDDDREVDSDLETEKDENYSREVYTDDLVRLKAEKEKEQGVTARRGKAPEKHLELQWVAGYRGHDCRDNVHYTHQG